MSSNVVLHPAPLDVSCQVEHHPSAEERARTMVYVGEHSQTRVVMHGPLVSEPGAPLHAPTPSQTSAPGGVAGTRLPPASSAAQHAMPPQGVGPSAHVPAFQAGSPGVTVRGGSPNTFVTHHAPPRPPAPAIPAAGMTEAEMAAARAARRIALELELAELEKQEKGDAPK